MQARFATAPKTKEKETTEKKRIVFKKLYVKKPSKIEPSRFANFEKILLFILGILIICSWISLLYFLNETKYFWIVLVLGIIVAVFFILFLFHSLYERYLRKINPFIIVSFIYLFLIVNMILGTKVYSIEWAFLGFVIGAVVFYDSFVDSRFLIFPALLLLGYVPFLIIGKQNALAETIAVYVYYFLVAGIGLQFAEYIKKAESRFDFDRFMRTFLRESNWVFLVVASGIISASIIVLNRFFEIEFLKWTSVYVFFVMFIFYIISAVRE